MNISSNIRNGEFIIVSAMLRLFIITNLLITCVFCFRANICRNVPSIVVESRYLQRPHETFPLTQKRRRVIHLFSSTRDEEIAKLEAQLRQLRENESSAANEEDATVAVPSLDPDDARTLKEFADARRRLEKVKGKDMLLTEQALIKGGLMDNSSNSSFGGAVPVIAVVIAAFVGIIAFAQIPIGQEDLARYSATGSSTLKSIDLGDLNPDVTNRL